MVRRNQANDKTAALALAFFLAAIEGAPSQARPENLSTAPGDYVGLGGARAVGYLFERNGRSPTMTRCNVFSVENDVGQRKYITRQPTSSEG
jgi:hypothetical protein